MKGLIGRKLGMTQIFTGDGQAVPVTVLDMTASTVLQVKTVERDGYEAIQVGYGRKKIHRASRPNRVRAEMAGLDSAPSRVREFRTPDASRFQVGDKVAVDFFKVGDRVKVSGRTKGRGFTGGMKRHGFGGGTRKTHGGGPHHRGVGSAGSSADPSRTMKGRELPGQYGNQQRTVLNLTVVVVDADQGLLFLKGAVPGAVNGLVTVELLAAETRDYEPARAQESPPPAEEAAATGVVETEEESPEVSAETSAEAPVEDPGTVPAAMDDEAQEAGSEPTADEEKEA
jgi:large subunit ribosomal protein L3